MPVEVEIAGFVLALCALIMTAIFQIFAKIERVKVTGINPMVFNIYFQTGVISFCVLTTIIVAIAGTETIHFTYMGLLSGVVLGIGSWLIWLSLTYMGIAHTSAVASGVASMAGFLEGLIIDNPAHMGLSIVALFLIVIGIMGVGFNEKLTTFILKYIFGSKDIYLPFLTPEWLEDLDDWHSAASPHRLFRFSSGHRSIPDDTAYHLQQQQEQQQPSETEVTPLNPNEPQLESDEDDDNHHTNLTNLHPLETPQMSPFQMRMTGIIFAFLGGICFGSLSFPEEFTTQQTTEAYFLPSFGVGVLLMLIVDMAVLSLKMHDETLWHFKQCFVPGLISGIIWGIGYLAILYAQLLIGYSLAIPIRECSICLAVIIGVFGFKEVTDKRAIIVTLICVSIAVVGCFLIAMGVE